MNNKILIILLLLLCINYSSFAQENADSLRIVNEALKMIEFPEPKFNEPFITNPTPKVIADLGFDQPYQSEAVKFEMRDGIQIHGQKYQYNSNLTVILLHGTLASSYTYNKMSGLLREALKAEIITIDLRGHGQSGGKPGDISTSNQYVEDLNDIISKIKNDDPNKNMILAGHSMGGGIILKYVETFSQELIDGYLLFAPNLGNNSPTTSQNMELKSNFIKIHLSRGLGLRMLNEIGIHQYDSLKVVFYNLPEHMPIKSYSYRSMEASYPEDYKECLRTITKPLFLLVGENDEAFIAKEYPAVIKSYSNGDCVIIEGESHNGIKHNEEAMKKISVWALKNGLK